MGKFIFDWHKNVDTVFFWGVGSGITPLFSIIKELLNTRSDINLVLVYGNKNIESTIFRNQIEKLKNNFKSNFQVYSFFSKESFLEENQFVNIGRVNKKFVMELMKSNFSGLDNLHFICGPTDFINCIKVSLLETGGEEGCINFEKFEKDLSSEELRDVKSCEASILFNGIERPLFIPKGKTILESALDNAIGIPYFCQTGDCEQCKGRLIEGSLKVIGLKHSTTNLEKNDFFSCCSYPMTESIKVEFD
jgi:ring-1,2-phenylacetyl-CoA epoxidase subunit PaaE